MNEKLKNCPFCGAKDKLERYTFGRSGRPITITEDWKAGCDSCNIWMRGESFIYQDSEGNVVVDLNGAEIAKKLWNKRAEVHT